MQTYHRFMIAFVLLTISLLTVTRLLAEYPLPQPDSKALNFQNTDFEILTQNNLLYMWRGKYLTNDRQVCNTAKKVVAHSGSCAFRFKARAFSNKLLRQKIDFTAGSNTVIDFSLWTKAKALSGSAMVSMKASYQDGFVNTTFVGIPGGTYAYTPVTGSLALTGTEGKLVVSIVVFAGEGKLWVDDLTFQSTVYESTPTKTSDGSRITPTKTPIGQPTTPSDCSGDVEVCLNLKSKIYVSTPVPVYP